MVTVLQPAVQGVEPLTLQNRTRASRYLENRHSSVYLFRHPAHFYSVVKVLPGSGLDPRRETWTAGKTPPRLQPPGSPGVHPHRAVCVTRRHYLHRENLACIDSNVA